MTTATLVKRTTEILDSLTERYEAWERDNPDAPREEFMGEMMPSGKNPFYQAYLSFCASLHSLAGLPDCPLLPGYVLNPEAFPPTARDMGRKGGAATTEAKRAASAENGKKGGRPRKPS